MTGAATSAAAAGDRQPLSNAISSPQPGRSACACSRRQARPGGCAEVEDHGIGIEAAQIERIFDRFTQADESITGTGLGLAICRKLVEGMGGTLEVSSVAGAAAGSGSMCPCSARRADARPAMIRPASWSRMQRSLLTGPA